jgi:superfamily II DNA or RNA helicase
MKSQWEPGSLVELRGRDWVVMPSENPDLLVVKPLGGSDEEIAGIYLPLAIASDRPKEARFDPPAAEDLGDIATARILHDAARLAFRNGAGPFRSLAKLSFRPRSYQMVPLIMALRQERQRLLIADDVGVGKTIEALLIVKELLERREIKRFAIICLPHLCEQWQNEIRAKLDLEAVIIRSNTQARLDRQIQGDTSVYEYYPYQIISIDYIKSDTRSDVFVAQCPELVIVDEAHTCTRPSGAAPSQQQRFHLLNRLARKEDQRLVLLTATPHSGKPEEFHSLLGLLHPKFGTLDLPTATQAERRELARYFVQRKRADVEKWMGEDTPFPEREATEWAYDLSDDYRQFFADILAFARRLIAPNAEGRGHKRVQYWTALALLRGVMSSPAAGMEMLRTRLDALTPDLGADEPDTSNPVADTEFGFEGDNAPTSVMEHQTWTDQQRQVLSDLADRLNGLAGLFSDNKLSSAAMIAEDWLEEGYNPVIFCRYIATANYLGDYLEPALREKFPDVDVRVITSELPDEVRKQRIDDMGRSKRRVLIATDCLSEGINLQQHFTGVLHYDLPWNPNRLEQREGRVDRFGQVARKVKACLLFGADNPIDGVVLDVLLRKVREIKKATGINVPFPEDSQSIIDSITQALLLNPAKKVRVQRHEDQLTIGFEELDEAREAKARVTRMVDEAAARETVSRSIFAQNAIKADEVEADLKAVDEAIGDPKAVEDFVVNTLTTLFGVQVTPDRKGHKLITANLPPQLQELLPTGSTVKISFNSPTPEGYLYIGRNHRLVEQLCQVVMANTIARQDKRAARAAVVRTRAVGEKTTLLLLRCRNVIEQSRAGHRIVAEEMLLWGWRGTPTERHFVDHAEAKRLLAEARASSELSMQARATFLKDELGLLDELKDEFDRVAEEQSAKLVAAHERFSAFLDKQKFQVVHPVLPMDLLGVYILLPENAA